MMRRAVVALVCAAPLAGCVPGRARPTGAGPHSPGARPRAASIPVVTTWGDLLERPAVELEDGVRVRFGIEAAEVPRGGGAFVYCLAEGSTLERGWCLLPGTERMGPVSIAVADEGESFPDTEFLKLERGLRPIDVARDRPRWTLLFLHPVVPKGDGTCRVRVYDDEGDSLAEAEVRVTGEPFHPWVPVRQGPEDVLYDRNESGPFCGAIRPVAEFGVRGPRGTAFEWTRVIPLKGPAKGAGAPPPLDSPLPQLQPRVSGFALAMDGYELCLSAQRPFEFVSPNENWRFLMRLWVNDRPVEPQLPFEPEGQAVIGSGIRERKLRFRLELDPVKIGAAKGDTVGLQLRYAPWAVSQPAWLQLREGYLAEQLSDPVLPTVSNRVDFVVR